MEGFISPAWSIHAFHHTTLATVSRSSPSSTIGLIRSPPASSSRQEAATRSAELAGVSHFLEHMTFKGTPERDALAVNRDFDRVGAKHNAQTSEEDTFYHVTCLPEYLPPAFDVLADILRPTLRGDDFETEKKVIIEEIRMYLDNPMSVAYEAAKTAHFGKHPLGNSILGTVESITSLRVDQMREYFANRYSPANMVLGFAGKGRLGPAGRHGRAALRTLARRSAARQADPVRGTCASQNILREDDQQQTVVGVCDAPPLETEDRYAAPPSGHDPRRPYRLSPLLDPDRPRPGRRRRAVVPGLQPGRHLFYVPELRARGNPGEPRPDRRGLSHRDGGRGRRGRTHPGQEQGHGPLGPAAASAPWAGWPRWASTGCTAAPT